MQTKTSRSRCPACGRYPKRTNEQNKRYWALIEKMAATEWSGQQFSKKAFHIYYASKFLGCEDITLPNGIVVTQPVSTSDEDIPDFGDYLTKVEADCNERGVFLDE